MLAVFIGGGLGSLVRVLIVSLFSYSFYEIPLGTLLVNWFGSAGIAIVYTMGKEKLTDNSKRFWMTGFFGGFTTLSIFNWEAFELIQTGHIVSYIAYVLLTLVGSSFIVRIILQKGRFI